MPSTRDEINTLDQQIEFVETLREVADQMAAIRDMVRPTDVLAKGLDQPGLARELRELRKLLSQLKGTMISAPKWVTKATTKAEKGIKFTREVTAGVDAAARMIALIDEAEEATGERLVRDLGQLFKDAVALLPALSRIVEGFSLNPVLGAYLAVVGKCITSIAESTSVIQGAAQKRDAVVKAERDRALGRDEAPETVTGEDQEALGDQLDDLLDDLREQRAAKLAELNSPKDTDVSLVVRDCAKEAGTDEAGVQRAINQLHRARRRLRGAWLLVLRIEGRISAERVIARDDGITSGGMQLEPDKSLPGALTAAETVFKKAYDAYISQAKSMLRLAARIREKMQRSAPHSYDWFKEHYPWFANPNEFWGLPGLIDMKERAEKIKSVRKPVKRRRRMTIGAAAAGGIVIIGAALALSLTLLTGDGQPATGADDSVPSTLQEASATGAGPMETSSSTQATTETPAEEPFGAAVGSTQTSDQAPTQETFELEVACNAGGDVGLSSERGNYLVKSGKSGTGPVVADTVVTLEARPHEGYEFAGWSGDTSSIVEGTPDSQQIKLKVDADKQMVATFAKAPQEVACALSFAHVAPNEYSEVYLDIGGPDGASVDVTLSGPGVASAARQTGTLSAEGTLRLTWRINQYGGYSVSGTVGGSPVSASVQVL